MAKKIRFPLQMNGTDVRTIEELREHFDIEKVLEYYANGKLVTWLRNRYYDKEAAVIEALSASDTELHKKIMDALGITYESTISELNIQTILRRSEKSVLIRQITDDENIIKNIDLIAFNQDDLIDVLNRSNVVYLWEGEFTVSIPSRKITLIGMHETSISLVSDMDNPPALNITFNNIHNIQSTHKKILKLLSQLLCEKHGFLKDLDVLEKWYNKAIEYCNDADIVEIVYKIGEGYYLQKNYTAALVYLQKAAAQDYIPAIIKLAEYYQLPKHYDQVSEKIKSIEEAIKCYKRAIKLGDNSIETNRLMVSCYLKFDDTYFNNSENLDAAISNIDNFYMQNPNEMHWGIQYKLSQLYLLKIETETQNGNTAIAEEFIQKMINIVPDDSDVLLSLACFFEKNKDYARAKMYYSKSNSREGKEKAANLNTFLLCLSGAKAGVTSAQSKIGDYYFSGKYVQQDKDEAKKWYELAASNGDSHAKNVLQKEYSIKIR